MQKLVWQNANGVELYLTSGNYGITEWEGFSNASLNIQSQQVPFQDGGVFLDALMEQRELSVTLAIQDNNNLELRYQQRRELISALNPKLGEGYLIYTNDYISKRIKCVPQIPLFETHNSDTVGTPKASLSWTACSPYWEDLEETEVEIGAEPTEVINEGECEIGFEADILASNIDNFILQNITTGQKIEIEDNIGTKIELNTKVGEKNLTAQATKLDELTFNCTINPKQTIWVEELGLYIGNIRDEESIAYIGTSPDGETWTQRYQANPQVILWNKYQSKVYALADGYFLSSTDGVTWTVVSNTMPACTCGCVNLYTGEMFFFAGTSAVAFRTFDGLTKTSIPTIIANTCCYNPKTNTVYAFKTTFESWVCKNSGNFELVHIEETTFGIGFCATGDNGNVIIGNSTGLYGYTYIRVCNSDLQELPISFNLPQGINAFLYQELGYASGMYIVSCLVPFTNNTFIMISKDGQTWDNNCFNMLNWYAQRIIEGKGGYACLIESTFMYITKFGEENKISKLTSDSDISLKLTQGANYLFYSASLNGVGTTEGVSVKLKYRQKYIGV
jgi:hypothetical protein